MNNVMVDLETLGTRAGCVILSIGAVAFDPKTHQLGDEFYKVICTENCVNAGLTIDDRTLGWWNKQKAEAKQVLMDAKDSAICIPLCDALGGFNVWLSQFPKAMDDMKVWGNGSDFDNAILANAYAAVNIHPIWKFWNNRCFRTLKTLHPKVSSPEMNGVVHNALADAKWQAEYALNIFTVIQVREIMADGMKQQQIESD